MFFKDLFQHISDRIETLQSPTLVSGSLTPNPIIRWIDFDMGQLEETEPPVSFPCALIAFGDAQDFLSYRDLSQVGELVATIKLGFKLRERTHSKAATPYRSEALEHLDTLEKVHQTLQGTYGDTFGSLLRTGIRSNRKANFRVYEMDYRVQVHAQAPTNDGQGQYIHWRNLPNQPATPLLDLETHLVVG